MNREEAMAIVEEAGLIYQNDGHPDIWYVRIAERLEYIKHLEATITLTGRGLRQSIDQAMSWLEHLSKQDVVDSFTWTTAMLRGSEE